MLSTLFTGSYSFSYEIVFANSNYKEKNSGLSVSSNLWLLLTVSHNWSVIESRNNNHLYCFESCHFVQLRAVLLPDQVSYPGHIRIPPILQIMRPIELLYTQNYGGGEHFLNSKMKTGHRKDRFFYTPEDFQLFWEEKR